MCYKAETGLKLKMGKNSNCDEIKDVTNLKIVKTQNLTKLLLVKE